MEKAKIAEIMLSGYDGEYAYDDINPLRNDLNNYAKKIDSDNPLTVVNSINEKFPYLQEMHKANKRNKLLKIDKSLNTIKNIAVFYFVCSLLALAGYLYNLLQ